jgi:hypothetical protein
MPFFLAPTDSRIWITLVADLTMAPRRGGFTYVNYVWSF